MVALRLFIDSFVLLNVKNMIKVIRAETIELVAEKKP